MKRYILTVAKMDSTLEITQKIYRMRIVMKQLVDNKVNGGMRWLH